MAMKRARSGKTMGKSIATHVATRIATRSVPGMLLVSGGLVAKTLFDRRVAKRKAEENASSEQAAEEPKG